MKIYLWIAAVEVLLIFSMPRASNQCMPIRALGAIPDDGIDDRAQLQAGIMTGCLTLEEGRYDVVTPPEPRSTEMLAMPAGAEIVGLGDQSVIAFTGDPEMKPWRGIELGDWAHIHRVRLEAGELLAGRTHEQTHVIRATGPISDIEIDHVSIWHPQVVGSKRGDDFQMVGYSPDKMVRRVNVHHNRFDGGRSAIAWHSGVEGLKFNDNTCVHFNGQCIDGEGNDGGAPLLVGAEICGNVITSDPGVPLAIQIMDAEDVHLCWNKIDGGAVDLRGMRYSEIDHNVVRHRYGSGAPSVSVTKNSFEIDIHDELIQRDASAGDRAVLGILGGIQAADAAPRKIRVRDVGLLQGAGTSVVAVNGGVDIDLLHVTIGYSGPPGVAYGIDLQGSTVIRADRLTVEDMMAFGPLKAAVYASGEKSGVGAIGVERSVAIGAAAGIYCRATNSQGAVLGPVIDRNNAMPAANCGTGLIVP